MLVSVVAPTFQAHERGSMIATVKVAVVTAEITFTSVAAAATDTLAERVVLYTAAATGIGWLWRNMLRPCAKVLHRMAAAVEALEDLPVWRRRTDRRIKHIELGLGQMASGVRAIVRELGIENDVRQQFATPAEFERWLQEDADLEAEAAEQSAERARDELR